jgi:hypothetical protein
MPFVEKDSQGTPVLVILPEVILRARKPTRVINDSGEPVLYCSEGLGWGTMSALHTAEGRSYIPWR